MFIKNLIRIKKCLILAIIMKSIYDDSKKLVFGIMEDETGVAIKEFVGLKQYMYQFLVYVKSEHKKAKGVNEKIAGTIGHNQQKNNLLDDKCLRHLMNRLQSKNHKIGNYEIKKISSSCFDDKMYLLNNEYDGLPLGYQS